MTPEPVGATPTQLTRSLVLFAALRAATDEGCTPEFARQFAFECATADIEKVKELAGRIAARARRIAEA